MHTLHQLRRSISLRTTLPHAWAFFADPQNLPLITPPWLGLRIDSVVAHKMYPGQILRYRVSPILRVPLLWVTEITHVQEPFFFVDEQRYGPYRLWHHQHFLREADGGVIAEDVVDYMLPFGPLGTLMHRLLVADRLNAIFEYRAKVLQQRFGAL